MSNTLGSAGYLFKKETLAILGFAALWSSLTGLTSLVMLCGLVLASAGVTRLWAHVSLKKVSLSRKLDKTRVFPDEKLNVEIAVSNRKLLTLFKLRVDEQIPTIMIDNSSLPSAGRNGFSLVSSGISLSGYSTARWAHPLVCRKRGYYPLGPVTLTSGDIFGFYTQTEQVFPNDKIIVFPRICSLVSDRFPTHSPLGETKADHNIYHDPSRVVGLRDYTSTDSLRHVHWKASARRRHLQVKVFESTVTVKTAIFLSVDSFETVMEDRQPYEDAIITAASIAATLIGKKSDVGFFANTVQAGTRLPVKLAPRNSHHHLMEMLEAMARCLSRSSSAFRDLVTEQLFDLPAGCTIVLILRKPSPDLLKMIHELNILGHRTLIFDMDGEPTKEMSGAIRDYFNVHIEHDSGVLSFHSQGESS